MKRSGGGGIGADIGAVADPTGAAVALLRLGLCDGSQALRRLGRANFRLMDARLPAVAEAVRVRHGRAAARQLASVATHALADAAALRLVEGADGFSFANEAAPVFLQPPEGSKSGFVISNTDVRQVPTSVTSLPAPKTSALPNPNPNPPHPLPTPRAPPPPPPTPTLAPAPAPAPAPALAPAPAPTPTPTRTHRDPGAELVALASLMKTSLSAVMAAMTPQLALLAQLDRRVAAANIKAASKAVDGGPDGALALADSLLARVGGGGARCLILSRVN